MRTSARVFPTCRQTDSRRHGHQVPAGHDVIGAPHPCGIASRISVGTGGLTAERGSRYATISVRRLGVQNMALYAFDGTWNSVKEQEDPKYQNTNVVRFYNAYHKHSKTDDYYLAGVGTRLGAAGKVLGGVFGLGELPRLNEAYDHLCNVWASGDHTIDVIGFSRGAATTLDFCH